MKTAEKVIEELSLTPHPEGGWFRRTYESKSLINSSRGKRPASTSILYLLQRGEVSKLHFLDADELWYFHQGAPLSLHLFDQGEYSLINLGCDHAIGARYQVTIGAGTIFGGVPDPDSSHDWSLVSCSVSPGFLQAGFFWPDMKKMRKIYKNRGSLLAQLAPSN